MAVSRDDLGALVLIKRVEGSCKVDEMHDEYSIDEDEGKIQRREDRTINRNSGGNSEAVVNSRK